MIGVGCALRPVEGPLRASDDDHSVVRETGGAAERLSHIDDRGAGPTREVVITALVGPLRGSHGEPVAAVGRAGRRENHERGA